MAVFVRRYRPWGWIWPASDHSKGRTPVATATGSVTVTYTCPCLTKGIWGMGQLMFVLIHQQPTRAPRLIECLILEGSLPSFSLPPSRHGHPHLRNLPRPAQGPRLYPLWYVLTLPALSCCVLTRSHRVQDICAAKHASRPTLRLAQTQ